MDEVDTLLLNLKKTVKRIENLLRDKKRCEFIPVCIPEAMAIMETKRLLSDLDQTGIVPKQIIVNNVMASDESDFCKRRKQGQAPYLQQINQLFSDLNRVEVPMFAEEVKGIETLNRLKRSLFEQNEIKN
jgi:arsenite-transporting ATPase